MTLLDAGQAPAVASAPAAGRDAPAPGRHDDPRPGDGRPRVDGKMLAVGTRRLRVRGVTYGTFAPDATGDRYPAPSVVADDFAAMASAGINAVRVYTVPPRWVLDAALAAGLWVLVGLPWEQHVAFLADRGRQEAIAARVRDGVAACAGHPALLAFAVGNEIPASIVRWHGRRRVERFLERLCTEVRRADPGALVTYVSFPSTEFLRLPFVDVLSFNVYLEDRDRLVAYVARLQTIAGEQPLLLAEIGLDSRRNGPQRQAQVLDWQLDVGFAGGCAGTFVFAWTDEWHRGEDAVDDWDFGLVDRDRRVKPALAAVAGAYAAVPIRTPAPYLLPRVSVVVCTFNGAATLSECLAGVRALEYPDVEVVVVDDGSTDNSAAIARAAGARVISTPNRGLSAARNTGLHAANGDIVAYLDDDAAPDRDWLTYLAASFATSRHAAVGGPNVPPADETGVASCVANAPGGPVHVLLSDTEAEHLPGCNMAFRRDALLEIGGFDEQFRVAGDDVDVCWRLQAAGRTLGFHPAALVWHRRRTTIRRFWRQQRGYGRAEALLERKWPEKYNMPGHTTWGGRLYGRGAATLLGRSRVYAGTWGTGAFQAEVAEPASLVHQLAGTPEWLLVIAALAVASGLGALWAPLLAGLPLLALAVGVAGAHAVRGARRAHFGAEARRPARRLVLRAVTFALHLVQPAARLAGRLEHGLVPWRRPHAAGFATPRPREAELWSEFWLPLEDRLQRIERTLRQRGARVRAGGPTDRWELHVAGGALGAARLRAAVEEHGRGRQLVRVRLWPRAPRAVLPAAFALAGAGVGAAAAGAWLPAGVLVGAALTVLVAAVRECGVAMAAALRALDALADEHVEVAA